MGRKSDYRRKRQQQRQRSPSTFKRQRQQHKALKTKICLIHSIHFKMYLFISKVENETVSWHHTIKWHRRTFSKHITQMLRESMRILDIPRVEVVYQRCSSSFMKTWTLMFKKVLQSKDPTIAGY